MVETKILPRMARRVFNLPAEKKVWECRECGSKGVGVEARTVCVYCGRSV